MKYYIEIDDRFKIGQYILGLIGSLAKSNKSISILKGTDVLIHTPNKTTIKALDDAKKGKLNSSSLDSLYN